MRPPLNVDTYCCASTRRSYDGATDSCHRGPGRNENVPAARRHMPPSSFSFTAAFPVHRVCDVGLLPTLAFTVQPWGITAAAQRQLPITRRNTDHRPDRSEFGHVTESSTMRSCLTFPPDSIVLLSQTIALISEIRRTRLAIRGVRAWLNPVGPASPDLVRPNATVVTTKCRTLAAADTAEFIVCVYRTATCVWDRAGP